MESFIDRIYKCDTIWLDDDKILTATSKSTCISFTCAGGHQDEKEIYKICQNLSKNNETYICHTCSVKNHKMKCLKTKHSVYTFATVASDAETFIELGSSEIWARISPPFDNYCVSTAGKVKNTDTNHTLTEENASGSKRVSLCRTKDGIITKAKMFVHILVGQAFLPASENPKAVFVGHINHDNSDNRIENLEWCEQPKRRTIETKPRDLGFKAELLTPNIVWKPYKKEDLDILVSNTGLIKTSNNTITDGQFDSGYSRGYRRYNSHSVHRLVLEAFVGLPTNINQTNVNHKNGNKEDNRLENLEWVTPAENNEHASMTGLLDGRKRKISQYDLNGTFIKEHPSQADAGRETGISEDNIHMCVSKSSSSAGGFIWKYSSDESEIKPVLKCSREIQKRDAITNEILNVYTSIAIAAKELNFSEHKVKDSAASKKHFTPQFDSVFYLCFSEEDDSGYAERAKPKAIERLYPDKITVSDTFPSMKKAAKELKMGESTVKKCCLQGVKDRDGMYWRFQAV